MNMRYPGKINSLFGWSLPTSTVSGCAAPTGPLDPTVPPRCPQAAVGDAHPQLTPGGHSRMWRGLWQRVPTPCGHGALPLIPRCCRRLQPQELTSDSALPTAAINTFLPFLSIFSPLSCFILSFSHTSLLQGWHLLIAARSWEKQWKSERNCVPAIAWQGKCNPVSKMKIPYARERWKEIRKHDCAYRGQKKIRTQIHSKLNKNWLDL